MKRSIKALLVFLFFTGIFFECNAQLKKNKIRQYTVITGPESDVILSFYDEIRNFSGITLKYDQLTKSPIPLQIQITRPRFFYFIDETDSTLLETYQFFVFPGDSVKIDKERTGRIIISGKHSKEYQLLKELSTNEVGLIGGSELQYDMINNFRERVSAIETNYKKRKKILEAYRLEVRPEYYQLLSKAIDLVYLEMHLMPYNKCSPATNFIPAHNPTVYIQTLLSSRKMLNNIDTAHFEALSGWLPPVVDTYCRFLTRSNVNQDNHFEALFDSASNGFSGKMRDLTLSLLMQDKINNERINSEYMAKYKALCEQPSYIDMVEKLWISKLELENDKELLFTMLEDTNGNWVSWQDVLALEKGKVIYVDFWASWCAGCKLIIPDLTLLKGSTPGLSIVSISIDESQDRWLKAIINWGNAKMGKHYRLQPNSKLAQLLAKPSIPRHTLVNKQGHIISIDAERPSSKNLKEFLSRLVVE